MSEEKRTNIVLDDLDVVTGGVSGFRTIKSGSLINKQVICKACGVINMMRDDTDQNKCLKCGKTLE